MSTISDFFADNWRRIIIAIAAFVGFYFLFFYSLTAFVPLYSPLEIATQNNSTSLRAIFENPIDAPYKLLLWIPFKLGHHSILWGRALSSLIGIASVLIFYFITRTLFSRRIALLSTLLFATSTGILLTSRLGTPLILQLFGILILISLVPVFMLYKRTSLMLYVAALLFAGLMYAPGMAWFILLAFVVMASKGYLLISKTAVKHRILAATLFLLLIAPLILAVVRDPRTSLAILALPEQMPTSVLVLDRAEDLFRSLFWKGTGPAEIMLVGTPVLNVIEISLIVIGVLIQMRNARLRSNLFVLGGALLLIVLIVLGNIIQYPMLMPFLYLSMASGLYYLVRQWLKVFPINPVANMFGTSLVLLLVATSCLYHARQYFIGWPHSAATHVVFSQPQPSEYGVPQDK